MSLRNQSIRTKLMLSILPAIAVLTIITVLILTSYFRWSTRNAIERQQYSLATLMANKLDDQFELYRKTTISFAKSLTHAPLDNPVALERILDAESELKEIFDNNIVIFSPDGRMLAETAQRPSRTGQDFSYRDYITKTRKNWQPAISSPFKSQLRNTPPVVMFTAPVVNQAGIPIAIAGCSINLLRPNLLGRLADTKIGENGYFYLLDQDRTVIMHPDRQRLLKISAAPGVNPLLDRAIAGFEGAGETVNARGTAMLVAYKRLASTNWILAAQIPASEAYASVRQAEGVGWGIALFALFLLGLLITLSTARLLAPLQNLSAQITRISSADQAGLLTIATHDEIGQLGTSFNSLLMQLQARERDLQNSRELYQFISDFSRDWIFWSTPQGQMLYISPAAEQITGYRVDELMADPSLLSSMVHPDDRSIWEEHLCQLEHSENGSLFEFRIINKRGQIRWLRHHCTPIHDADGRLIGIRGSNDDITERQATLLTLQESEERFRLIANAAHDAIVMLDQQHTIRHWNPSAERLFGMPSDSALNMPVASFIPGLQEAIGHHGDAPHEGLRLELLGQTAKGTALMLEISLSRARIAGEIATILLVRDITERKLIEQRLQFASLHDSLTGLYNRTAYDYHREQLDAEGPFPVSVIVADLDGLKEANDRWGHDAGDRLICAAAELLTTPFRTQDIVARIGGDEFVMLLPGMGEAVVEMKLERLHQRIEQYNAMAEDLPVSLSLGVAIATEPNQLTDAIGRADQQMYANKAAKKNNLP